MVFQVEVFASVSFAMTDELAFSLSAGFNAHQQQNDAGHCSLLKDEELYNQS